MTDERMEMAGAPKSSDHRVIYANTLKINISLVDLQIALGQSTVQPDGKKSIEEVGLAIVPLVQAKALTLLLLHALSAFEATGYPIGVTQQQIDMLDMGAITAWLDHLKSAKTIETPKIPTPASS
jgi:hypothetical protein